MQTKLALALLFTAMILPRTANAQADSSKKYVQRESWEVDSVRDKSQAANDGCTWPFPGQTTLDVFVGDDLCTVLYKLGAPTKFYRRITTAYSDRRFYHDWSYYRTIMFEWSGEKWVVKVIDH